ncbi:MAG: NAD(P)/FAD-dependent oxidoreductase [Sandaracinaceae bacterium]
MDVVIAGGGLAGLCLARQLRRELPELGVTVVERVARPLPEATHKVGESSVELASHYFGEVLGLRSYLEERHLIKNGLRFFPGGGELPLAERTEIGPPQLPIVPSFQIDRGRFENDLRAMCEKDGVTLIEGVAVRAIEPGQIEADQPHRVILEDGRELTSRWLVDATGRRRMLSRKLGLGESSGHHGHAAWFRVERRLDVDHLVPREDEDWHKRDLDNIRWLSTSHLMGEGYWVWLIPLSTGHTSVGIVVHGDVHAFDTLRTAEAARTWLETFEPELLRTLGDTVFADFRVAKDYSYTASRCFSPERWSLVGEAGLFVDPFYSPGSDFIAMANGFTTELIKADVSGEPADAFEERVEFMDWFYRRLALISTLTYRDAAAAYGEPRVLAAKIYWDNFNYWAFVCQYWFQDLYKLPIAEQRAFLPVAERFAVLNERAQKLFSEWAQRAKDAPERRHVVMPPIPSMLANLHLDLEKAMTPDETVAYMSEKADLAEELLTEMLLRAVLELGGEAGASLTDALGVSEWTLRGVEPRLQAERGGRRGRRKRISRLVRDLERTIGAASPAEPAETALDDAVAAALPWVAPAPAE